MNEHIQQQFDKDLEDVRSKTLAMGGLVERQVANAITSVLQRDQELGEQVASLDYEVNSMEVEIDEECSRIIARRQPAAGDLRLIVTIIKVITDLERIGDEAEAMGRYAAELSLQAPTVGLHSELQHLGDMVQKNLHETMDAFTRMDDALAIKLARNDRKIDKEFDSLSRLLITHMIEDPRNILSALRVSWCARALERIGDHTKNICEYIIFRVKGKDIRHTSLKKVKKEFYSDKDKSE